MKGLRAGLRIAGLTIFVVLTIALLAVGGLWTFAQSDRGGEIVRRLAIRKVNARIAGAVVVGRLRFGGDRLTLDGVELRDPEGSVVARAASIDILFSPLALLRRHVDLRRLEIRRPELRLATGRSGTNLGRVFAPAHPSPAPPVPAPNGAVGPDVVIDLRALAISEGTLIVRASLPEIHVSAIAIEGSAHYDGRAQALKTDLHVVTEAGRVDAQGAVDLATMQAAASGLAVRVRGVDLAKLMRDTPASDIDVDLDAHGERIETDLRAQAPGATVTGHGALDAQQMEARLRIEASDLAATARGLARCHLAPPVVLAGRGQIDLVLSGPRERPSLQVAGRVPQLTAGDDAVRDLVLRATIPRLDIPTAFDLDLTAAFARLSGRPLRQIAAEVRASAPHHLAASMRASVPYPVALAASGRWLSAQEIEIAELTLRYPKAAWALTHPTRIGFGEGSLSIAGLDLRASDGQSVRADLEKGRGVGHLHLAVSRLDLGRLPPPLLPAALAWAGKLDLDVDLRLSANRLRGSVAVHGLGTGLRAKLDLPATWPPRTDARAPMRLTLTMDETDLGTVAKTAAALTGREPPFDLGGKIRLSAELDGSAAHPRLELRFDGHALTSGGRQLGDLAVVLQGDDDRPLKLQVDATGRGLPPAALSATTPLSLGALLRRRPSVAALERTPFEVSGQVAEMSLASLGKLAGRPIFRAGTISVQFAARGSAEKPLGTLAVDLKGVTTARIPATDARLEIEVDQRATKANVRIVRLGHPLLALESRFGVGLAALHDRARLVEAPVYLRAVIGPLEIRRLRLPGNASGSTRESALEGVLHADLTVDGTLRAPRLEAHVQADDLRLDKKAVGYARLETRYGSGKTRLEAQIASANGGALTLEAGATADLGLPALLSQRPDPTRWPFELGLKAQKLDLRGLSGLTETLRRAGGLFDADLTAHGTVRDPRFKGRAECTRCALQLAGVGDFREIHLAVHGDTDKVVIDELAAKEGDGNGRVTASLTRVAEGEGYRLIGTVEVNEIPAYSDGQPLAHVSLNAALSGNSGGRGGVAEATVDVRDAHVKLAEGKRRQLQSLQTPEDVVIVDDGQPIDRAQAKKLRALGKRHAPALSPKEADAASPPAERGAGLWKKITIAVTAPHKLWVSGGGAALELGLGPGFRIVITDETSLHGEVIVRRGRIDALGRRFDIQGDSSLRFEGAPDHPTLDATAQFQDSQDNVTVLISAKGPVDHLTIGINSPNRPDLNQSQLYTLIITGRLPSSAGGSGGGGAAATASNEASSLVAGVIAGQLQKTLSKRLPLDVLTIDTGGGQGLTGTQLEAGRYVTDRLYVGYVGRIGADPTRYQNRNAVHFEYQLTARWQIAGEYGDVGTGSADLMWKKSY